MISPSVANKISIKTASDNPMFNGFKSLRNFINKEAKNQENTTIPIKPSI